MPMPVLTFSDSSEYYGIPVFTFSIPAGYTCPGAEKCLAYAHRQTGKIINGKDQTFRCYAATGERFPGVRDSAWRNYDLVRSQETKGKMFAMISGSIPHMASHIRVHQGGDMFSQMYFDAWLMTARMQPHRLFWTFTKNLPIWIERLGQIPNNFKLTASKGGKWDHLIEEHSLRYAEVFHSWHKARRSGLPIDTDDKLAYGDGGSFALVLNSAPVMVPQFGDPIQIIA